MAETAEAGLLEHELVALWLMGRVPAALLPWPLLRAGRAGRGPGPDVREATFALPSGVVRSGDVEVHLRASDFVAHGHLGDPAYGDVVLHLVWDAAGAAEVEAATLRLRTVAVGPAFEGDPARLRRLLRTGPSGCEPCASFAATGGATGQGATGRGARHSGSRRGRGRRARAGPSREMALRGDGALGAARAADVGWNAALPLIAARRPTTTSSSRGTRRDWRRGGRRRGRTGGRGRWSRSSTARAARVEAGARCGRRGCCICRTCGACAAAESARSRRRIGPDRDVAEAVSAGPGRAIATPR